MLPPWVRQTADGLTLLLLVQPKASKTQVVGVHGDPPRLKIRVAAPPVEGEANEELLRFLKKRLQIPLSQLSLLRGQSSRQKDVHCQSISLKDLLDRMFPGSE